VQFVLRYTYEGGSSTESLINHLKSKHVIHVIFDSEDHKTIPTQEGIRSQIVKKEMSLFEAAKKRSSNLEKTVPRLNYIQISGTRGGFISHGTIRHKTQKQTEWWKCALIFMRQYYKHDWKTVLDLINNSLLNCAGTNSSNIAMILSFIAQNRIHFKTRKKGFSRVSFLSYPKPGFLEFAPNWKH